MRLSVRASVLDSSTNLEFHQTCWLAKACNSLSLSLFHADVVLFCKLYMILAVSLAALCSSHFQHTNSWAHSVAALRAAIRAVLSESGLVLGSAVTAVTTAIIIVSETGQSFNHLLQQLQRLHAPVQQTRMQSSAMSFQQLKNAVHHAGC